MKRIIQILLPVLWYIPFYAQSGGDDFSRIVEAEMKQAYSLSAFAANPNTGNYDVVYQRLELTADPDVYFISGSVTTHFVAKEDMSTITFDLTDELTVSSVAKNNIAYGFTQNGNELVISLPAVQNEGVLDSLTVTYSGPPADTDDAFVTATHSGAPVLWTLSQPYGAKDWWPCKQDLNDKIDSVDVYITAPAQYVSVSNGVEISQQLDGNGNKTTHFRHNYPIPAYLIAIAISNYTIFNQTAGTAPNTFPIVNYLYPETAATAQNQLAVTVPIMNLFEELFETYPYHEEKYGHAQCGFGGGMEHTTVSFMGSFGRELIAHELGHQWFGDKITCGTWKDIWLNEGFATYLSGLVVEGLDGNSSFINWKNSRINNITSQPGGYVYLADNDTLNIGRIFSSRLSYNKGAMIVHMLRFKMGDTDFYQGLKNYLADPELAFGYATTPDLKGHLEAVSGMDLTEFFNDWLYRQGYPTYTITAQNVGNGQVKITINQSQSHPSVTYFEMPVPVRLLGDNGEEQDVVLDNTFDGQEFFVPSTFTVTNVLFDPEKHIISRNNQVILNADDFSAAASARLYPNPAHNKLYLELPQGLTPEKTIFYNALGQKVIESTNETSWNIGALSTGVHFLNIVTAGGTVQLKFIKE